MRGPVHLALFTDDEIRIARRGRTAGRMNEAMSA